MKSFVMIGALLGAAMHLATPRALEAQVWKAIKEQAVRKAAERKAKADSAIVARVGQTVDSTLAKSGRGVDTAVNIAAGFADQAVAKTEQTVAGAAAGLLGRDAEADQLAADLADGRAVLREIRFDGATDGLLAGSGVHLDRLARVLASQTGGFLIELHVDGSSDAAADKARSERRALAVKAHLVAAGVPVERLFVMGLGATRPAADGVPGNARIEVARLQ